MQRAMPDIGHITGELCPGHAPVGSVIAENLSGAPGLCVARFVARRKHPAMARDDAVRLSTRTGLLNPNSRIKPAICATCASEWGRALLACAVPLASRSFVHLQVTVGSGDML
jgi:hypothetical protein